MEEDEKVTDEAPEGAEREPAPPQKRRPEERELQNGHDNGQRAAGNGQRAEDSGQRTAGGGQRAAGSGQGAEDGGQRAADGGQQEEFPLNTAPGLNAPAPLSGGELWVGRGRREEGDGGERAADSGQQGADRGEFQSHPAPRSYRGRGRGGDGWRGGGGGEGRGGGGGWRGGGGGEGRGGGGGWRDGGGGRGRGGDGWRGGGEGDRRGGGEWRGGGGEDRGGWEERGERQERPRPPPEQVERQIVLPGDKLDDGRLKDGSGTYREEDGIYAACLGLRSIRSDIVSVIPLSGKYIPRVGDIVIGKVIEMTPSAWVIDLNSPYVAPLPGSETPWTVEFGETSKYMAIGDTLLVQIRDVNEVRRVGVTMIGPDLRKLVGGQTIDVDATKVPRIIGRGGSMIGLLKRMTRCRIMVGQNGRIWLDGTVEDVTVAMGAIRMIEANAHRLGLTDAVAGFIQGMRGDMQARREKREKEQDVREERAIMEDRVHRAVQPSMELEEGKKEEE